MEHTATHPESSPDTVAVSASLPPTPNLADGLPWSDKLATGDAKMDDTHHEFIVQLNAILDTPMRDQLPLYRAFLAHTVEHFAQEERWMLAIGFAADNCHASHHATILDTMRAVEDHYCQGDNAIIQRLAEALVEWFPQHAATMDAGLAQYMAQVGFDSTTETLADPSTVRPATMSGCGSVSCS